MPEQQNIGYKQHHPVENLRFVWVMAMPLVTLFLECV